MDTLKNYGSCSGIAYVDSTKLPVCHHKRMNRNRVFKELAAIGKSTMGWCYGFKLHLIVNERGELLSVQLAAGNIDDRQPLPDMCNRLRVSSSGIRGTFPNPSTMNCSKTTLGLSPQSEKI